MTRVLPIRAAPEMPPEAPLAMVEQDFGTAFHDPDAPPRSDPRGLRLWRFGVFVPTFALTGATILLFADLFRSGGVSGFEALLIGLIGISFFWIALTAATGVLGVFYALLGKHRTARHPMEPLNVALLVPIHAEVPEEVMGNAWAMMDSLSATVSPHRFSLYLLSDTGDPALLAQESVILDRLRLCAPDLPIFYRAYPANTERKTGNIAQWVERWGGHHDAMIVLDADSLMSAGAIAALTDALACDPGCGLVQSTPRIYGARTLFCRVQQFGNAVYGGLLGAGLSAWVGCEGNYWGHNAILRTKAFAHCAGLPRLIGWKGEKTLILSHDFVEAALLRRAGWGVQVLPALPGTYEEAPQTLVDFIRRDRRWCFGNLQHLRLLGVRGLHPISRFHLFQGAMSYLVSPVWLCLLLIWAVLGVGEERSLLVYFSGFDPRPHWPEMTGARQVGLLVFLYGMLLAPKILGLFALPLSGISAREFGGWRRLCVSFLAETALSVAYAPILMIQQTRAVAAAALGWREGWSPYRRRSQPSWEISKLVWFHIAETAFGIALCVGITFGFVTLWLLPIALSLCLAVPLSAISGWDITQFWLMATEDRYRPPGILQSAMLRRRQLRDGNRASFGLAAE